MKENRDIVVENGGVSSPGALAGKTLRVSIPRASGDRQPRANTNMKLDRIHSSSEGSSSRRSLTQDKADEPLKEDASDGRGSERLGDTPPAGRSINADDQTGASPTPTLGPQEPEGSQTE